MGADRRRHAEHVMGTGVSFDVPGRAGDPRGAGPLGRAGRWLDRVEAPAGPCGPELAEVLEACAAVSTRSGGYFTTTPGGRFDPSGYVKGWAVERAAGILTAAGPAGHSVNGGGDGQCGGARMWRGGVAAPPHPA